MRYFLTIYSEVHTEILKSLFPHGQVIYGTISLHAALEHLPSVVSQSGHYRGSQLR